MAKKTRLSHAARLSRTASPGRALGLLVLGHGLALAAPPAGAPTAASAAPPGVAAKSAPAAQATPAPAAAGADRPAALSAATSAGPLGAAGSAAASKTHRGSVGCLIGPERTAEIGSPVTGVVAAIRVDRGDEIHRGQVLVTLEQGVEQAYVQAARARSGIDAEVRSAEASLALARERFERLHGLRDSGAVAALTVDQAKAERDVAEQRLAQARDQRKVVQQELGVAQAQLAQRNLRAPFDGVVVDRLVQTGERVEDKPLLRVAQLDPLRVELVMPASRWGSVNKGDAMAVVPELPGADKLLAQVTHIDRMLDAASNTFRVRLSLPNPGHRVPAGARCKLDGAAPDNAAASASPTPSVAPLNLSQGSSGAAPAGAAVAAERTVPASTGATQARSPSAPAALATVAPAAAATLVALPSATQAVVPTRWKRVSQRWLATARRGLAAKVVPDVPVYAPAAPAASSDKPAPRLLFTV